jgi:glycosyltransferase involved in cell wall biosynthesis
VRKRHILFILENSYVPHDQRVWNEALEAKAFGYDVTVLNPASKSCDRRHEKVDGIEIYRHPTFFEAKGILGFLTEYGNAIFWELLFSLFIFIRKPFHVIHAANPPDHIVIIALLYRMLGTKFVFDHHDLTPEAYVAKFGRKDSFYRIALLLDYLSLRIADVVISTNESYKKIAVIRGKRDQESVFVVRNGPNIPSYVFKEPSPKIKEGFDFLVVYVGIMNTQDGIENLLEAAKFIIYEKSVRNIKFVLIGYGPDRDRLIGLSQKMGLESYVKFTGFIPEEEMYEIIATADVCVNPEFRNEFTDKSTMIKIMEYMIFGKPIVQFYTTEGEVTAGEAAEYVRKNEPILFAEKIMELLNDPGARKRMGEIGRKRIFETLNWDRQKVELKKAYEYMEKE